MALDETTRTALSNLTIPPSSGVQEIRPEQYVDASGDPAIRVWLILPDETDEQKLPTDEIRRLKASIRESLAASGVVEFPYVFLAKQSEM